MFGTFLFFAFLLCNSVGTFGDINGTDGIRGIATTASFNSAQKHTISGLNRNNTNVSTSISTKSVTIFPKETLKHSNNTSVENTSSSTHSTRKDIEVEEISIRTFFPESTKVEAQTTKAKLIKKVTNPSRSLGEANSNGATIAIVVIVIIVILIICAVIFYKRYYQTRYTFLHNFIR